MRSADIIAIMRMAEDPERLDHLRKNRRDRVIAIVLGLAAFAAFLVFALFR